MTQVLELTSGSRRAREARIIGLVSAAHFASHFFMLLLPVLLPFVRADYGVSYTELGLAGLGNTVYHPADYAVLSQHVAPERLGQAFSIHTFAGLLGSAVAPAILLLLQGTVGWRGAFVAAGLLGGTIAATLLAHRALLDPGT